MAECDASVVTGEAKIFVLLNVPEVDDKEDYLIDYLESLLHETVAKVHLDPNLPDRVLVLMAKKIDIKSAARLISRNKFEEQTLTMEAAKSGNILKIDSSDLNELTVSCIKRYFQKEFAEGQEVISCCLQIPGSRTYAVSFYNQEVMERVLTHKTHHVRHQGGIFDIEVEPFYLNFHGHIAFENKLLYQALEQAATTHNDMLRGDVSFFECRVRNENSAFIVSNSKIITISFYGDQKSSVMETSREVLRMSEHNIEQQTSDTFSDDSSSLKVSMVFSNAYFNFLSCHHKPELCEALKSVKSFVNSGWNKTVICVTGRERAVREATVMMERIHRKVRRELHYAKTLLETDRS